MHEKKYHITHRLLHAGHPLHHVVTPVLCVETAQVQPLRQVGHTLAGGLRLNLRSQIRSCQIRSGCIGARQRTHQDGSSVQHAAQVLCTCKCMTVRVHRPHDNTCSTQHASPAPLPTHMVAQHEAHHVADAQAVGQAHGHVVRSSQLRGQPMADTQEGVGCRHACHSRRVVHLRMQQSDPRSPPHSAFTSTHRLGQFRRMAALAPVHALNI